MRSDTGAAGSHTLLFVNFGWLIYCICIQYIVIASRMQFNRVAFPTNGGFWFSDARWRVEKCRVAGISALHHGSLKKLIELVE